MNTNKLPVFRTFGNALGFAVGDYFTVLRLAWLPFTLLLAANFGLAALIGLSLGKRIATPFFVFAHIQEFAFLQATMWILQLIVVAAVAVSIHRIILFGDRRPGVYLSFRFGRTEFVYAAMALIWGLIILAIMATVLTPVLLLVSGGDLPGLFARVQEWAKDWPRHAPDLANNFGAFAGVWFAYVIGWIVVLYVSLRLCVWPPSVVATNRLSPGEAWRLTDGNALRLFGLFFLTIFVVYAVVLAVVLTVVFALPGQLPHFPAPAPAAATVNDIAAERERIGEKIETFLALYWPAVWLAALLVYGAVVGMTVALISYSYKALKGYDAQAPIPDGA